MRAPGPADAEVVVGEVLLSVENVSLSFGGVKAVSDVSFDIRKGEIRAIIGPNGAGKTSMLNVINGFYHPQHGRITYKGETAARCVHMRRQRHRPHLPERRLVPRHDRARQHHDRPHAARCSAGFFWQAAAVRAGACRGDRAPPARRGDHRLPQDPGNPPDAGRPAALRPAEARRARPRAGDGAGTAAARRADGRHEPGGKGGHVAASSST